VLYFSALLPPFKHHRPIYITKLLSIGTLVTPKIRSGLHAAISLMPVTHRSSDAYFGYAKTKPQRTKSQWTKPKPILSNVTISQMFNLGIILTYTFSNFTLNLLPNNNQHDWSLYMLMCLSNTN